MKAETERASQALENMRRQSGRYLARFQEEVGDGTMFKGASLSRNNTDDRMFEQSKGVMVSDVKQFLASRFQDFSFPVLKACVVISNPKSWQRDRIDLGLYQEQELVTVALAHFQAVLSSNGFDLDLAKGQWLSLTVLLRPQA